MKWVLEQSLHVHTVDFVSQWTLCITIRVKCCISAVGFKVCFPVWETWGRLWPCGRKSPSLPLHGSQAKQEVPPLTRLKFTDLKGKPYTPWWHVFNRIIQLSYPQITPQPISPDRTTQTDFHKAPGTLMKGEGERKKEIHSGSSHKTYLQHQLQHFSDIQRLKCSSVTFQSEYGMQACS